MPHPWDAVGHMAPLFRSHEENDEPSDPPLPNAPPSLRPVEGKNEPEILKIDQMTLIGTPPKV